MSNSTPISVTGKFQSLINQLSFQWLAEPEGRMCKYAFDHSREYKALDQSVNILADVDKFILDPEGFSPTDFWQPHITSINMVDVGEALGTVATGNDIVFDMTDVSINPISMSDMLKNMVKDSFLVRKLPVDRIAYGHFS